MNTGNPILLWAAVAFCAQRRSTSPLLSSWRPLPVIYPRSTRSGNVVRDSLKYLVGLLTNTVSFINFLWCCIDSRRCDSIHGHQNRESANIRSDRLWGVWLLSRTARSWLSVVKRSFLRRNSDMGIGPAIYRQEIAADISIWNIFPTVGRAFFCNVSLRNKWRTVLIYLPRARFLSYD